MLPLLIHTQHTSSINFDYTTQSSLSFNMKENVSNYLIPTIIINTRSIYKNRTELSVVTHGVDTSIPPLLHGKYFCHFMTASGDVTRRAGVVM